MRFSYIPFLTLFSLFLSFSSGFLRRGSVDNRFSNSLGLRAFSGYAHGTLQPRAATSDLEAAALGFIKLMQTIENGKYKDRKVLIVGGQAIQHYYPGYRETDVSGSPSIRSYLVLTDCPGLRHQHPGWLSSGQKHEGGHREAL